MNRYNKTINTALLIALVFIFVSQILADDISLKEFTNIVRNKSNFLKATSLNSDIDENVKNSYLGINDLVIKSSLESGSNESLSPKTDGYSDVKSNIYQITANKINWKSGTETELSYTHENNHYDLTEKNKNGFKNWFENGTYLTIKKPLLKNKGGIQNRQPYELAEIECRINSFDTEKAEEDFILRACELFLTWILNNENLRIIRQQLQLAEEQFADIQQKCKSHLLDKSDLIRAENALLTAKENLKYVHLEAMLNNNEINYIVSDDVFINKIPVFRLYDLNSLPDIQNDLLLLKENSLDVLRQNTELEYLQRMKSGIENEKYPELNFSVFSGLKNEANHMNSSLSMDKNDYGVKIEFKHTFGQQKENATLSVIILKIKRAELMLQETFLKLEKELNALYYRIKQLQDILKVNYESVEISKSKTKEEIRLFNLGKTQLTEVIDSRNEEMLKELAYIKNLYEYHKCFFAYFALQHKLKEKLELFGK